MNDRLTGNSKRISVKYHFGVKSEKVSLLRVESPNVKGKQCFSVDTHDQNVKPLGIKTTLAFSLCNKHLLKVEPLVENSVRTCSVIPRVLSAA